MTRYWSLKFWAPISILVGLSIALSIVFVLTLIGARTVEKWNTEYSTWHSAQLEAEYWRMIEGTYGLFVGRPEVDRQALDTRIDIFISRAAIFDAGLAHERLLEISGAADLIAELRRVMVELEPLLRAIAPGDEATMAQIQRQVAPTGKLLKSLSVSFEHYETNGAIESIQSLRNYFILGAILIGLLILSGVVLIGFLLGEIRERRRLLDFVLASQRQARVAEEREASTLIESGRRFRAIAMANPVALVVCDVGSDTIRYANPSAARLLGISLDDLENRAIDAFFADPGDVPELVRTGAIHSVEQRETTMRNADGGVFPVSLSVRALEYDSVACVVIGILDLTEKQAAQREIERQREVIHHREKLGALGSLLAGVAHELNNPLSIVMAQASLLEEHAIDPGTVKRGAKIRGAAERCARIVKTFLAMARQQPPLQSSVDANKAVDAALELLSYGLRSAGIEVRRDFARALPMICADSDRISQVLTNLIVNAQQAMGDWPGPRRLTIATRYDASARRVEITVSDSGPGVPRDVRSRIFEPFFTTKPVGVSTGIGLSVCHSIVVSHGGSIEVEDAPGGGAAFVVRLPLGETSDAQVEPVHSTPAAAHGERVLVIDDEPEVAQTLADILSDGGYRVDVVADGEAALDRLRGIDYAVVLSDIRMPGMDGMQLYRRLQDAAPDMARRLIFVTGDALSPSVQSFLAATKVPRIEKPFFPDEVRRLVAEAHRPDEPGPPVVHRPRETTET